MTAAIWISVFSAVFSAASAFTAIWVVVKGTRATDFASCLDVASRLAEAQRRVRDARDDVVRDFELRELLNLMEALALLINEKRIASTTKKFTEQFLIESYAFMRTQPSMRALLEASVTGDMTFSQMLRFAQAHKRQIEMFSYSYEQQSQEVSS